MKLRKINEFCIFKSQEVTFDKRLELVKYLILETEVRKCFSKYLILKMSQYSQGKTCAGVSF